MIAFIKPPEEPSRLPRLRHVRRLLGQTFLAAEHEGSPHDSNSLGWKAWVFLGWLAAATLWGFNEAAMVLARAFGGS